MLNRAHQRWLVLAALVFLPTFAFGQSGITAELNEITDNRFSEGPMRGGLEVQVKLNGKDLDRIVASRVLVKEAFDDKGTKLVTDSDPPDFQGTEYNNGVLSVRLASPTRAARTVRMKGTIELFVPSRDPNAVVKVTKALSKLDKPLSAKGLKASKVTITPLSPEMYVQKMQEQKITDDDIAKIREEGKKHGATEEEVEAVILLAKAFEEAGNEPPPPGAVILSASAKDMDRIQKVRLLAADGTEVNVNGRSTSSRGESAMMILNVQEPPPSDAMLEFTLLTDKAKMSVPFELKGVELP